MMNRRLIIPTGIAGGASVPFGDKIAALSPSWWLKMNETSGTTITDYGTFAQNATFTAGSGALGQAGIGDGGTSILFDGTATQVAAAGVPVLTMPAAGTMMIWCKFAAATWTDGTSDTIRLDRTDTNNYVRLGKGSTNNILAYGIDMGGTADRLINLTATATTDWFLFAGTWDGSGIAAYQVLKGGTLAASDTAAATGTWATGTAVWQLGFAGQYIKGNFAHMLVIPSKLSQTQLQDLANV